MKDFLKLFNFEFNRIYKFLLGIIGLMLVVQTAVVVIQSRRFMSTVNKALDRGKSEAEVLSEVGVFELIYSLDSLLYMAPFILGLVAVMFYSLLVWYRDWLGKNTFIYRLLMLPTSRMNVFLAKLATVMTALFTILSVQFLSVILQQNMAKWIVKEGFFEQVDILGLVSSSGTMWLLYPNNLLVFLKIYSVITLVVILIFIVILLERSFKIPGAIIGVIYGIIGFTFLYAPFIMEEILDGPYLYPGEMLFAQIAIYLMVLAISLLGARYLLKNKVTV